MQDLTYLDEDTITADDFITIIGANENNLKNVSVKIPRNQLVVITGLSGSGKSSLCLLYTSFLDHIFSIDHIIYILANKMIGQNSFFIGECNCCGDVGIIGYIIIEFGVF